MKVGNVKSIRIKLASPQEILAWSHGEVTKPETINYRTQRPEKDGLFCEKIFGPTKDYECYCGKYKKIRYKGVICEKCGVEVTKSAVRRERMGHIKLAAPVSHIWFLRGVSSRMGVVLDLPMQRLGQVIYFAGYIITKIDQEAKNKSFEEISREYQIKLKKIRAEKELSVKDRKKKVRELKEAREQAQKELSSLESLKILSEAEYQKLTLKYGEVFEAETGAEAIRTIFEKVDLKKTIEDLRKRLNLSQEKGHSLEKVKTLKRLRFFRGMERAGLRPEWMFLTVIPVLPPDLRPMVQLDGGRYASSDLNELYRRVINRNNRLKYLLEIAAPEVIVRNEKRMLQEAVDSLIDNGMRKGVTTTATTGGRRLLKSLADILRGKQGRFRQNLLGKRVDYSGRSVIVVGPELKLDQCGLPKKMASELFKPFVIKEILDRELAYNIKGASRLIEQGVDEVWAILEEVVKDKLVLLNRAPTLHRLGVQAFQPVLVEGEAIRIHPLVCKAFNADFDGDQMAVHLPLSKEAQKESRERMLSTLCVLKPATGTPVVYPTQDIVLGCYWITKIEEGAKGEGKIFGSQNEAILAYDSGVIDLRAKIKVRMALEKFSQFAEISVGKIFFNRCLPKGYPFVNEVMSSKKLEKVVSRVIGEYDSEIVKESLDEIKELGFEYSTFSGISWGITDLVVPPQKEKIIKEAEKKVKKLSEHYLKGLLSKEEKSSQAIRIWEKVKSEIGELVPQALPPGGSVFNIVDSGARVGSWGQVIQMTGMKGLVTNPLGQIIELPVKSCYKEGFQVLEYFISTHGARKGTADTALRTSTAGYLTRRLIDVAHGVIITEEDCGDTEGITVFRKDAEDIGQNFFFKILGRVVFENVLGKKGKVIVKKGEIIDWSLGQKIKEAQVEKVRVRSPLSCKSHSGTCRKCYGWDLGNNQLINLGEAVGIVAAQAIGEPGTQLTLRTFHTGGIAGGGDITMGLPRVEEIFEARKPRGKAVISRLEGKVLEITSDRIVKIEASSSSSRSKKLPAVEYEIPPHSAIWVKPGQEVQKGEQLCEGNLDIKELFKICGPEAAWKYIINEIQRIYCSQGATIHDKHLEIVVGQMFSRMKVLEKGDTSFSTGQIVEKAKFFKENDKFKKEKKKLATGVLVLLGITEIASTSDSFLSAASFQETSRVLIKACLEGRVDKLRGLKENVIIGKLIPAGTGFKKP